MVRHRTQRLNQVSSRYTEMKEEFYIPKEWRKQDIKNKQGSVDDKGWNPCLISKDFFTGDEKRQTPSELLETHCQNSYELYKELLEMGIAREMARMVLPQNLYTEIYSNWDLNNLMHFFTLRLDEHAQWEIREYAKAMYSIAKEIYPWTIEAFEKYKWKLEETL